MGNLSLNNVIKPEPGWYAGDFHLHTNLSDGYYAPDELVALCKHHRLDFIAITDHNTIAAFPEFSQDPNFLVIPGIEVSFNEGHWNVFGMEGMQGWLEGIAGDQMVLPLKITQRTTSEIMAQAARSGLLNSINHPLLVPWEWQDRSTRLELLDCLEIWNDPLWPDNERDNPRAVAMWTDWLNAGYRITAIGGSDFHFLPGENDPYPGEYPGLPVTYVYAQSLSGSAILEGLRQRRVYVSMGPQVIFRAHLDGKVFDTGADLGIVHGELEFSVEIKSEGHAKTAQLVKNGEIVTQMPIEGSPSSFQFSDLANADQPTWLRLELLDQQGKTITITNPIFYGPPTKTGKAIFGDFLR
ncbi:MAG: CehA/McbA family metallohydrolase [Anaerolineales bacterium]|nr:CehA/McbA family metallohydrolase [Anaerolineales bacterium]